MNNQKTALLKNKNSLMQNKERIKQVMENAQRQRLMMPNAARKLINGNNAGSFMNKMMPKRGFNSKIDGMLERGLSMLP